MDNIDISKIRGHWQETEFKDGILIGTSGGDDTIKSIKMVAEKINEIIDWIESKKAQLL